MLVYMAYRPMLYALKMFKLDVFVLTPYKLMHFITVLKGALDNFSLIPNFFSKTVEIFIAKCIPML